MILHFLFSSIQVISHWFHLVSISGKFSYMLLVYKLTTRVEVILSYGLEFIKIETTPRFYFGVFHITKYLNRSLLMQSAKFLWSLISSSLNGNFPFTLSVTSGFYCKNSEYLKYRIISFLVCGFKRTSERTYIWDMCRDRWFLGDRTMSNVVFKQNQIASLFVKCVNTFARKEWLYKIWS